EQPLRRAPKGKVYRGALLRVVEGRKGLGFLEGRPVVVIDPKVEHVVGHHPEHHPVAEHAGLAEHTPHRDAAERSELLAQELGKPVARNHPPSSVPARSGKMRHDIAGPSWRAVAAPHSASAQTDLA